MKAWLDQCRLVAVLRGLTPEDAVAVGSALVDAGVVIMEVPLNSPEPYASIERLQSAFGDRALIGAGTVMRVQEVREVMAAGGKLVVSPHAAVDVVRATKAADGLAMPGFFTPTEAFAVLTAGADALKLFPAEATTPATLKALRAVLPPGTLVLPVGGVGLGTMAPWVAVGAAGFGIGSSLYRPGDRAAAVGLRARALLAELASL